MKFKVQVKDEDGNWVDACGWRQLGPGGSTGYNAIGPRQYGRVAPTFPTRRKANAFIKMGVVHGGESRVVEA